jgi:hypothetical protein
MVARHLQLGVVASQFDNQGGFALNFQTGKQQPLFRRLRRGRPIEQQTSEQLEHHRHGELAQGQPQLSFGGGFTRIDQWNDNTRSSRRSRSASSPRWIRRTPCSLWRISRERPIRT